MKEELIMLSSSEEEAEEKEKKVVAEEEEEETPMVTIPELSQEPKQCDKSSNTLANLGREEKSVESFASKELTVSEEMKEMISWTSLEENLKGGQEDMMTISQFSQSRGSSPTTPCHPISTIALDGIEGSTSYSRKRVLTGKAKPIERAEEVKANLDPGFPSLVRSVVPSHVSGDFRLRLPKDFCNAHLPKQNTTINLINENQEKYPVQYLVAKTRLGGGWKGFSIAHKLVEGDALVFHLVKPTEFQVYIIRAHSTAESDGVLALPSVDAGQKRIDSYMGAMTSEKTVKKCRQALLASNLYQAEANSKDDSEEVGSEVMEGIRYSETNIEFKDVKNPKDFTVVVDGLIIDSNLPDQTRTKYYELCCSQNAFLHDNLIKGTNSKLAAGVISQTINIADTIRACKFSTSPEEFAAWDKHLEALEHVGMNVGFLRARLQTLVKIVFESEDAVDSKRYREALIGRADIEETVKAKLAELEEASKRFDNEIETLKAKVECHELKFQAAVNAPW